MVFSFPRSASRLCNIWYPLHCYSSLWHARLAQTAELQDEHGGAHQEIDFFFSPPSLKSRIKVVAACGPGSIGWDDVKAVSFSTKQIQLPSNCWWSHSYISYIPRTGQKVWIKQSSVWFISSHNREHYRLQYSWSSSPALIFWWHWRWVCFFYLSSANPSGKFLQMFFLHMIHFLIFFLPLQSHILTDPRQRATLSYAAEQNHCLLPYSTCVLRNLGVHFNRFYLS